MSSERRCCWQIVKCWRAPDSMLEREERIKSPPRPERGFTAAVINTINSTPTAADLKTAVSLQRQQVGLHSGNAGLPFVDSLWPEMQKEAEEVPWVAYYGTYERCSRYGSQNRETLSDSFVTSRNNQGLPKQ